MKTINSIFMLLFLYFVGIIQANKNNYYIITIKDTSIYSFNIQPTKQGENELKRRGEGQNFNDIDIEEIHEIINSKNCVSQLYNDNINNDTDTSLCDLGKSKNTVDIKKLEKELEPEESFVNEQFELLAELIIENLDSYKKDDLVTEEIHSLVRKRSKTTINDIISDKSFEKILTKAYNILDVTVFYGYLSDIVYEKIKKLPNVIECIKNFKIPIPVVPDKISYDSVTQPKNEEEKIIENKQENEIYYNITDIKTDTQWSDVSVEPNAGSHLSLISQSKVDFNLVNKYDSNFYYPSTAGEGVDIYIMDNGIDVNHVDFDTTDRTITCDAETSAFTLIEYEPSSSKVKNCTVDAEDQYHGIAVASAAAGTVNGVAKKANVHVIAVNTSILDYITALKYIEEKAKNPHKTIINISSGMYQYSSTFDKQINVLINKGFMIFAAAGNEATDGCSTDLRVAFPNDVVNDKHYPSGYIDVISVGSINNVNEEDGFDKTSNIYSPAWFTNYGSCVDFFAPGYANLAYISNEETGEKSEKVSLQIGTSFSSPIVAGIAATLISEHSEITFNQNIMKQMLLDLSIKGVINDLDDLKTPNHLINIGKQVVYSPDNEYKGCGIPSGKKSCPADSCCSSQGYCGTDAEFCEIDCQSEFGQCSVNNHPAPEKPKEESEYRDTLILNYYNDRDMCIKFIPGNYLDENVIMTICDEMDTDTIWHIAKEGDTKIIENFYEDTCILLDENGLAYADGCENGAVFKDIMTVFNKDAIQSDAFPDKCLKPVASDFDPYGITIFTEDRGVRVMMDDCDYSDKYQHWRFREVPEHEYENVEYIYITETTANNDDIITTGLIENEFPSDIVITDEYVEYVFTSIVEDENPSEAITESGNIDDAVEVFVTENDLPSEVITENVDIDEEETDIINEDVGNVEEIETDVITENVDDVDEIETEIITENENDDEKETSRPKKSPLTVISTELIEEEEYTDFDNDLDEEEHAINNFEENNEEYSDL